MIHCVDMYVVALVPPMNCTDYLTELCSTKTLLKAALMTRRVPYHLGVFVSLSVAPDLHSWTLAVRKVAD
jgi:hypothetical protein